MAQREYERRRRALSDAAVRLLSPAPRAPHSVGDGPSVGDVRRYGLDARYFAEHQLNVVDEQRRVVGFGEPYPGPVKIFDAAHRADEASRPARIIICKARRHRASATTEALIVHRMLFGGQHLRAAIVTDEQKSEGAGNPLFGMAETYYEHLHPRLRPSRRPAGKRSLHLAEPRSRASSSTKKVVGGLDNVLTVHSATAGARRSGAGQGAAGLGRAARWDMVHCSEVGFWPNAEDVFLGFAQTVPEAPGTLVVIESTSNGMAGFFYDHWKGAIEGDNDYEPIFLPWYDHPEYRGSVLALMSGDPRHMPSSDDLERFARWTALEREGASCSLDERGVLRAALGLTDDEVELCGAHPVDYDQVLWRRWALRNRCGGKLDKLDQEYPPTWEASFAASGSPRFSPRKVSVYLERALEPTPVSLRVVSPEGWRPESAHGRTPRLSHRVDGSSHLWLLRGPEYGHEYVIPGDAAQGLGLDASSALVFDRHERRFVAMYHNDRADAAELALQMAWLGWWYNVAVLAPESNKDGVLTVHKLVEWGYPRLHYEERYDQSTAKPTKHPGFATTPRSRPLMMDHFAAEFDRDGFVLEFEAVLDQMRTFVKGTDGKEGAMNGCHDDLVIAAMIGLLVDHTLPPPKALASDVAALGFRRGGVRTPPVDWSSLSHNETWARVEEEHELFF